MKRLSCTASVLFAAACASAPHDAPAPSPGPPRVEPAPGADERAPRAPVERLELPPGWGALAPDEFAAWVDDTPGFVAHEPRSGYELDDADHAVLATALEVPGTRAVRAAVVLGRSGVAAGTLLAHLERRAPFGDRADDAASVVAAAALAAYADDPEVEGRLAALAAGSAPHPDLEVRVECARSALALGAEEVVPFLLVVLRIDTWDGQLDERDFTPSTTTAWVRERAAEALARRLEVPNDYRADASIEERQAATLALAESFGLELPTR